MAHNVLPPLLDLAAYRLACVKFLATYHDALLSAGYIAPRLVEHPYAFQSSHCGFSIPILVVQKPLQVPSSLSTGVEAEPEREVTDLLDCERLSVSKPGPLVEYTIVLSPSYHVPVLFLNLRHLTSGLATDVETIKDLIVPRAFREQVDSVGVMGALTLGEHPSTGYPAYYVHPCNTAQTMSLLGRQASLTEDNYMQIWLGVVGPCVGFELPLLSSSRVSPHA